MCCVKAVTINEPIDLNDSRYISVDGFLRNVHLRSVWMSVNWAQ